MTPDSPARVPPDGENPYPRIEGGGGPIGYTDPRWRAWQEGFSAGSGHLEVIAAKAFAAGRAAASPDPPDEDAIRADERERLSARVYENGWCPTCAAQPAPGGPIPGPDPGACPRCGGWRKAGMIHRCPAATPDPPDMTNMCEGESPDHKPGITPAASPDERLREAGELERFLSTMAFVLPNLNDTFAFACADTEKISVGDGKLLADFWRRHGWRGLVAIAAVKRKAQPLAEVAATPEFQAAYAELLAGEQHPDEDGEPWTLADEFEIDGQADALAAADREAPDEETP